MVYPSALIPVILLFAGSAIWAVRPAFTVTFTAVIRLIWSGFSTPSGSTTVPFTLKVCSCFTDGSYVHSFTFHFTFAFISPSVVLITTFDGSPNALADFSEPFFTPFTWEGFWIPVILHAGFVTLNEALISATAEIWLSVFVAVTWIDSLYSPAVIPVLGTAVKVASAPGSSCVADSSPISKYWACGWVRSTAVFPVLVSVIRYT